MVPFYLKKKNSVAFFLSNLTIVGLNQILESYGLITINNNIVKCVLDTSGYGGNYS